MGRYYEVCTKCLGTGEINEDSCGSCGGYGNHLTALGEEIIDLLKASGVLDSFKRVVECLEDLKSRVKIRAEVEAIVWGQGNRRVMNKADEFPVRYKVVNLYDTDWLVDENNVVILLATKPPSVEDMQGIAKVYNERDSLASENRRLVETLQSLRDCTVEKCEQCEKIIRATLGD